MSATFADPATGQIVDLRSIKDVAIEAATDLVDEVWREISDQYNVGPLTSLKITQKIVNAVLSGAVAEHIDILAEPLKPVQKRLVGMES